MKNDKLLLELEDLVSRIGYRIRKERGNFRGSNCVLDGDRIIMLNKNHPPEVHINLLSGFIKENDHDDLFIKPAVRKALEKIWDVQVQQKDPELDFG
jgi:hypothetical protein